MSAGQFKPIRASIIPPAPPSGAHVKLVRPTNVPAIDEDDDAPIGGPRPTTGVHRKPTTLPAPGSAGHAKPGSAGHAKPGSAGHRKPTTLPATAQAEPTNAPGSAGQPGAPGSASHRKPTTLPSGTHTKPTQEDGVGHWSAPATASFRRAEAANPAPAPATGSHARPTTAPATDGQARPATGSFTRPATGSHARPVPPSATHAKPSPVPATATHAKPNPVPATARHAKPTRKASRDVSMGTFVATVLGLLVAFGGVVGAARRLRPVAPFEEPPAWSYDRDAALLAAAAPAAPVAPEPPEPVKREAIRLPVVVANGAITFGADDPLTEEVEATLTVRKESFDKTIQAVHRDLERQEHWIDLVDGRRIEVDAATATAVFEAQPYRMTYARADEPEQGATGQ